MRFTFEIIYEKIDFEICFEKIKKKGVTELAFLLQIQNEISLSFQYTNFTMRVVCPKRDKLKRK